MAAMELLCHILGINPSKLSKKEILILEAELFFKICQELRLIFKSQYKIFFDVMKFNTEMEDVMIDDNFLRFVFNDILSTRAYTLSGIALYTQTPEDIIYEVASGLNTNPSFYLVRKIIELHRNVHPDLYKKILAKDYKKEQLYEE